MTARLRLLASETGMVLVGLLFALPIGMLVMLSLHPQGQLATVPWYSLRGLSLENYVQAWRAANLGAALLSSVLITGLSVALVVIISSVAAYYLARVQSRLSHSLYILFLLGIVLPAQLALVPLYSTMKNLGLLGTPWGLILCYVGLQLPFSVFLYAGFLRTRTRSYEEAGLVDGATHTQVFRHIVLPLLRPVTGTVLILNGIFVWNDFLTPLLYVSGTPYQTLPVAIYAFVGQYTAQWGIVFAGLVMSMLPILMVYFALQRSIIQGFASGVKG